MNAHLNLINHQPSSMDAFQISSTQFSSDLQQQLMEAGQQNEAEKSPSQLLNDYMANAVPSGSIPKNLTGYNPSNLASAMAVHQAPSSSVRTDVLSRLLFSSGEANVAASVNNNANNSKTLDLCQQALNELQSSNLTFDANSLMFTTTQQHQNTNNFSAVMEPLPINEDKMTVMQQQQNANNNTFQLMRQQQHQQQQPQNHQQMNNLLNMLFVQSDPAGSAIMKSNAASVALDISSLKSGANSTTNNKRSLGDSSSNMISSALMDDLFRPAKKQRGVIMPPNRPNASSVTPIMEDSVNQSGRFRDYQSCKWSIRFHELQQFRVQKGHCCVPHGYTRNPVLARWVKRQRYQYKLRAESKASTMTIERINALERIGFVWDSHGAAWMERYNELKEYAFKFGNCNISSTYIRFHGTQLSSWVKCQRRQYKMYKEDAATNMTPDRISKLESIGFAWELRRCRTSNNSNNNSKTASSKKDTEVEALPVKSAI